MSGIELPDGEKIHKTWEATNDLEVIKMELDELLIHKAISLKPELIEYKLGIRLDINFFKFMDYIY